MANYLPKGVEYMRELGRKGGCKSGEVKRRNTFILRMLDLYTARQFLGEDYTLDQIAEILRPRDRSSGNHDTDWRCPKCGHFSSAKRRWECAKCGALAPVNGRRTRAAIRKQEAKRRTAATSPDDERGENFTLTSRI